MGNLVVLDSTIHRDLRVTLGPGAECAKINVVSVIPRELPRLLAHFPIFFTKSAASGRFEPAALLGFTGGENLFYVNGRWDAEYVPLQVARQPFSVLSRGGEGTAASPASLDLAFDPEHSQVNTPGGERVFLEDGKPAKLLENVSAMLKALVGGSPEAYAFTGRLAELNLIEPVQIDVEFVDRSTSKLQGLYWIAAPVLKALPAAQLGELRDQGYLEWMYYQMASLAHMATLVARKNRILSGLPAAGPGGAPA